MTHLIVRTSLSPPFSAGPGAPWSVETAIKCTGPSAMKSGSCYTSDPNNPSYSYIETGVYGPGHLYFWWKVSCYTSDSYLYLAGTGGPTGPLGTLASITGEVDWTQENVFIPPGYHILQWRYQQGTLSGGSNAGWLDGVAWLPTQPTLVVRGLDNGIYYREYNETSQAWGSWDSTPTGATCDSPAAAMFQNYLNIVVRGMDGTSLWCGIVDMEDPRIGFEGWWPLGGATMSAPTLISNGTSGSDSDVMCLVVRGLDNRVYYRLYDSVHGWGWEDWNVIPNGYTSDSPAAAMLGNELIVVVRGMNSNTLWYTKIRTTDNYQLKGWTLIPGATPSKPVLAPAQDLYSPSNMPTMLYLTVRGMDNGTWYRQWWPDDSPPSWGSWTRLLGATCDAPAASWWWTGFVTGNYLHFVVRGLDGNTLWNGTTDLGTFSGWTLMDGATPSAPTLAG